MFSGRQNSVFLPCHTQAVERPVKTVTEASGNLCLKTTRKHFIEIKIEYRELLTKMDGTVFLSRVKYFIETTTTCLLIII